MPRTRASVYSHFTDPSVSNTLGNCRATCMHCGISVSGSTKATSNFRRHLQRRHPEILQIADSQSSTNDQKCLSKFMSEPDQTKWRHCDPHQIQMNDQLVKFIATDLLPLSTVESISFRQLLHTAQPRFNLPSRKYLSTILLPHQYAIIHGQLKSQTQQVQNICLSVDAWSSMSSKFFIGIIAHFILDFTYYSIMLGCHRLNDNPDPDTILKMYLEITSTYDIARKVSFIVTDNVLKAFNFLPDNQNVGDGDDNITNRLPISIVSEEYSYLPCQHSSCFAHSLQLVVCDSIQQNTIMKELLVKAVNMVGYCKTVDTSEGLDTPKTINDVPTWNNQLKILQSIKKIPEEVLARVDGHFKLDEHELKIIEDICEILKPFEEVMDRIDGEQVVTSSLVIACVRSLRQAVARQKEVYKTDLVAFLESSIEKHLSQYETMEEFKLAAMVDPRFKLDWCTDDEVQLTKDLLMFKADLMWSKPTSHQPIPSKRSKMFSFMTSRSLPAAKPWASSAAEVSEYLNQVCVAEEVDPLEYWQTNQHRYPILAQLASIYLAIPASSKSAHRIYSNDGKIFQPETCTLSDTHFEQLMLIRCNYKTKE